MAAVSPMEIEMILDAERRVQEAGHGGKQAIYQAVADALGCSLQTLYRKRKEVVLVHQRKRRADAGRLTVPREAVEVIAQALMEMYRANDKKMASIALVVKTLVSNGKIAGGSVDEATGEFKPWSPSTITRALRHYGLHPDNLRNPTPARAQASLHPNDVWQMDASISTLFYAPEAGPLQDMSPAEFYKNKPGNFEKIKRDRLTRYVVTDHTSGAIFAWYVRGGESLANMGEALLEAMREKKGEAPYGSPFHLQVDAGTGATANFRRFCAALDITLVVHKPGNPRAKGQVEQAHNIVETQFEFGFKLTDVPSIDWINAQARRWCRWYNATRVHTRHQSTRLMKWMEITPAQLRLVDVDIARDLFTREPEPCRVNDQLQVRYRSKVWDVEPLADIRTRETILVTLNPLNPGQAYVVTQEAGEERLIPINAVAVNEHGFVEGASLIGREIKTRADTVIDRNRKAMERAVMGAETDTEAAQKRKAKALPFGGEIDPYKHLDDLPAATVMPRRGTALQLPDRLHVEQTPLTHIEMATALRPQFEDWGTAQYQRMAALYPDGVMEDQLTEVAQRLREPDSVTHLAARRAV